jgi:phage terminase large subunit-like protein
MNPTIPTDPEARARLVALLEARADAVAWRCPDRECSGEPHQGREHRHARGKQQPPWGELTETGAPVRRWYLRGGRGSGKTWAGAHALAEVILWYGGSDDNNDRRTYGVVGPDFGHARAICVEGPSGLLAALGGENGPHVEKWNRDTGELTMKSGAVVLVSGIDSYARKIEGTNLTAVWCDEVGLWSLTKWQRAWEQAITFAVRKDPAFFIITGTPKQGHPLVQRIAADDRVRQVVMGTRENRALAPGVVKELEALYAGTRLGRQELDGEVLTDTPGALWSAALIEEHRLASPPPPDDLIRIVVGWDPAVTSGENADEHGIIVAAQVAGDPSRFVVLDDRSARYTPMEAVAAVTETFHRWNADSVIAETNQGGDLIAALMRTASTTVPVKTVTASRGKRLRAEPVAMLSEQGRLHLVGAFPKLEDQMTTWTPEAPGSPDRLDALVWAITALTEQAETSRAFFGRKQLKVGR